MTLPQKFQTGPKSKQLAAYIARKYGPYGYPKGKAVLFNPEWTPENHGRDRYRWVENASKGLRFVGKVHEVRGNGEGNVPYFDRSLVNHTGWFVDNYQSGTVSGEVYQLPARNGESLYIPAVGDPDNDDCAVLDFHSITSDLKDAIRWADSMAERYAEDEREGSAKDQAEQRIAEIEETITAKYAAFKALAIEVRGNCDMITGLENVKRLIRAEYRRVKASIRKLRVERAKLQDNFWAIDPNY
jgi:hypothetical protein